MNTIKNNIKGVIFDLVSMKSIKKKNNNFLIQLF